MWLLGFLTTAISACLLTYYLTMIKWSTTDKGKVCWNDLTVDHKKEICQLSCTSGYFSLPGMTKCQPWLGCEQLKNVTKVRMIGQGAVKKVYIGKWDGYDIVINEPNTYHYIEDFQYGLDMLTQLQGHNKVTQLMGMCNDTYFTQYFSLGSAENIIEILTNLASRKSDTIYSRFKLCLDYLEILNFLHNNKVHGVLVMCDSNDLNKTLQQYLVREDLSLFLNDVDSIAKLDRRKGIKCGHRELVGEFIAPEQLWPFDEEEFTDSRMPTYDEMIDIWKIPDVCNHFLGSGSRATKIRLMLLDIHTACKSEDPVNRPSAAEVLQEYQNVWDTIKNKQ